MGNNAVDHSKYYNKATVRKYDFNWNGTPFSSSSRQCHHSRSWEMRGRLDTRPHCTLGHHPAPRLLLTSRYWQWAPSSFSLGWKRWSSLCNISFLFQKNLTPEIRGKMTLRKGERVRGTTSRSWNCWVMQNSATSNSVLKLKWNTEWLFLHKSFFLLQISPLAYQKLKKKKKKSEEKKKLATELIKVEILDWKNGKMKCHNTTKTF